MERFSRHIFAAALLALLLLPPGESGAADQAAGSQLSAAQLEQLAAPVALYPDALVSQVLMAATYPLEVVSAARWAEDNAKLQGDALDAAVQKQPWDPSVKSLVKFPQVLRMMNDKLDWMEQLGNAFLAQPKDVMDAVQRLRAKAEAQGNLTSNAQQTVTTQAASGSSSKVIVIQPAQPDVIYVPTYNPTVVYGAWPYPANPPYAWYPPGYVAGTALLSFGVGVAVGYSMWGYPDWHGGHVDINVNNYTHFTGGPPPPPPPRPSGGPGPRPPAGQGPRPGGDVWSHNPDHRGNVPYTNAKVAEQFRRPGQSGPSPAQQRINAREAFRGRSDAAIGRQSPGKLPSGGHISRPGGGEHSPGQLRQNAPERRQIERTTQRGSVFQGLQNHGAGSRGEWQRGTQSRQIMRAHPDGGGFHPPAGGGGLRGRLHR
ncbi:conserved exported hypothetical protein [uncultured delta proteobacterium]|uniref:DUF3300 domain-containing protein n=1 Tax=uncultured delta proteobacterium TaxID=34034 RepID=A0A212K363_9DELT|nr:conserved exported hypothetical protein [uncultured delta proteobacterium]